MALMYPPDVVGDQVQDIARISFNIRLALEAAHQRPIADLEICDLGGGLGMFSLGCAALGFRRSVLIDDFRDSVNTQYSELPLILHAKHGVTVISRDVVADGLEGLDGTFDVITSFDSIEHWHHSPKKLFHQVASRLKPGGAFVLGAPNCVNLRKRLTTALGYGKWSRMEDWYESPVFRGHVREPDVDDLQYIARDMGLTATVVHGRNWAGHRSNKRVIRLATSVFDVLLRRAPSLCSDIYITGIKA